jgi:hypothetical protein
MVDHYTHSSEARLRQYYLEHFPEIGITSYA